MQTYNKLYFGICCKSLALAFGTTFALNMVRGPAAVPVELTGQLLHLGQAEVWTRPANVQAGGEVREGAVKRLVSSSFSPSGRSWTSSSSQRWSVLGFPQYGSSCLGRRDDLQELVSFSSSVQP